jgi:hypothetical protein
MSLLETFRKSLTPEQFTMVQDAVGDDFDWDMVPRSRLNKVIKQRNELREKLTGNSQPQGAGSASSNEDDDTRDDAPAGGQPPVDIKKLEKEWKEQQDKAVRDVKIQYAALEKLRAAKAIDAELIWKAGVIDRTKLSLDDTGALVGLDDIIADLQKSKAHLFMKGTDDAPAGTGKDGGDPFKGVTTKEEFLKLDADKQIAFKQANPALFKQFLQS